MSESVSKPLSNHAQMVAVVSLLASVFGWARYGVAIGASVALGASLTLLNLIAIALSVRSFMPSEGKAPGPLRGLTVLKHLALFGAMFVTLKLPFVSGFAFGVGMALFPIGVVLGELR
jgi:hypothetical protein